MNRTLLIGLGAAAILASVESAVGSDQVPRYHLENAWPSKAKKVEALSIKQKRSLEFNPKEFTIDKPVRWMRAPKTDR